METTLVLFEVTGDFRGVLHHSPAYWQWRRWWPRPALTRVSTEPLISGDGKVAWSGGSSQFLFCSCDKTPCPKATQGRKRVYLAYTSRPQFITEGS